jgi:hypothetical protein
MREHLVLHVNHSVITSRGIAAIIVTMTQLTEIDGGSAEIPVEGCERLPKNKALHARCVLGRSVHLVAKWGSYLVLHVNLV